MEILTLNERSCESALHAIDKALVKFPYRTVYVRPQRKLVSCNSQPVQNLALIVDGDTLSLVLQPTTQIRLLELARRCRAVICCRVSPIQKARNTGNKDLTRP
jgi:magnesium-transporting ATPase (P-type)